MILSSAFRNLPISRHPPSRWHGPCSVALTLAARVPDGVPVGVPACAARRGRRALPCGRRPRRPACLMTSPWASPCARRAEDVAPYHVVRGRGRRPRWPACLMSSPCARRAGDVAPYHVVRGRGRHHVERGRGRRPRRPVCLMASPWASPRARRAEDVAPYHVVRGRGRHHVVRGRGRRPRRPARLWASTMASPALSRMRRPRGSSIPRRGTWCARPLNPPPECAKLSFPFGG